MACAVASGVALKLCCALCATRPVLRGRGASLSLDCSLGLVNRVRAVRLEPDFQRPAGLEWVAFCCPALYLIPLYILWRTK